MHLPGGSDEVSAAHQGVAVAVGDFFSVEEWASHISTFFVPCDNARRVLVLDIIFRRGRQQQQSTKYCSYNSNLKLYSYLRRYEQIHFIQTRQFFQRLCDSNFFITS